MTSEEAALLSLLNGERGGVRCLSTLSRRNQAVAGRMEANTNFLRVVSGCACLTEPGRIALKKHNAVFETPQ